jgi:DNA-directed RNA polymerase subunit RPC12/RpoP
MPKIEPKLYRCQRCGKEKTISTNHWGEVYERCEGCSWKNPMDPQGGSGCLEPKSVR